MRLVESHPKLSETLPEDVKAALEKAS
jgi:hypothetical protein